MSISTMSSPETEVTRLRERYCRARGCDVTEFEKHLLSEILFPRARFLNWLFGRVNPDLFHPEKTLCRQVARNESIKDTQLDVDFYQHKYVVGSFTREDLKLRASGVRLLQIAKRLF